MVREIQVNEEENKITVYNEGKDGSLYETTIYLRDKEKAQEDKQHQEKIQEDEKD